MRGSKVVMFVVGLLLVAGGGGLLVTGIGDDGPASMGVTVAGGTLLFVGLVFLGTGTYIGRLDTSATLHDGVPGTAQVLFTQDTGTVVGNVNLVVRVGLRVSVPGRAAYDTETRWVARGRQQWAALQPGMTVAVMVDPADASKVAIDTSRPVMAAGGFGGAAGGFGGFAPPQVVTRSAAEIIAAGVKVDGQLLQVVPTGMTAGQAMPGLPPEVADDPVVQVAFSYPGPDGALQHQQTLVRVPDGKAASLVAGRPIPIAVLQHDLSSATIDWSRLP